MLRLDVGACAIPQLLKCQMVLKKEQQTWFGDELPIEIKIPEHVHSTFTCPILRTQTTKENPPMRLGCGHVISREALSRLSQGLYKNQQEIAIKTHLSKSNKHLYIKKPHALLSILVLLINKLNLFRGFLLDGKKGQVFPKYFNQERSIK